jgi:hypothetical protein
MQKKAGFWLRSAHRMKRERGAVWGIATCVTLGKDWRDHCNCNEFFKHCESVVALHGVVCLTSAPSVAGHRQGDGKKARGRRGIRGNSAKKKKSKRKRILRQVIVPREHAATSWSNELQSLASSSQHPGCEDRIEKRIRRSRLEEDQKKN